MIANCALKLRGAMSLFRRVNIRNLIELENHCQMFLNVVSTLLERVNLTAWTKGYAV